MCLTYRITNISFRGTSSTTDKAVFRECYSRLHELRSLAPNVNILALTATATSTTKKTILDVLLMKNPYIIYESPNKSNIAYSVLYMARDKSTSHYFEWLGKELLEHGTSTTRTIIYCQTIKQCSIIYSTIKGMLRKRLYVAEVNNRKRVLLEMLHSCTPDANKEAVLKAFSEQDSEIRVLVATIAFGMGVDCKGVYRIIHFGPSKNVEAYIQETGRAGRDSKQSVAYIIYQGLFLNHVDKDIKLYVKSEECRRKTLLSQFDSSEGISYPQPLHLCCDNCSKKCECKEEECGKLTAYPSNDTPISVTVSAQTRQVTEQHKLTLSAKLTSYHKSLVRDLISKSPHGQLPALTSLQFMLGFSTKQISQVLEHCHEIFSLEDITRLVEIWHIKHAVRIVNTISQIFGDCCTTQYNDGDQDTYEDGDHYESDTWLGEWNLLLDDEELFELAVQNLSVSMLEFSMNESNDNRVDSEDVPRAAVSALDNLKLF